MRTNQVAPFEGELVWVGDVKSGKSQRGTEWTVVEFTIKYPDGQWNKHVMFSAFGADKVAQLKSIPIGTKILVKWMPDAREYNGRWFGKNDATEIKVADEPAQQDKQTPPAATPTEPIPSQANNATASDATREDEPADGDLPF